MPPDAIDPKGTGSRQCVAAARERSWHVAVVSAPDGLRLIACCRTERELVRLLAKYVALHAARQLWPADARRVRSLLRNGELEGAVAHYFARVGGRWDNEQLLRVRMGEEGSRPLKSPCADSCRADREATEESDRQRRPSQDDDDRPLQRHSHQLGP